MKKVSFPQYFESAQNLKVLSNGKSKLSLCHYPMMGFEDKYLIHGHLHNNKNNTYRELPKIPRHTFTDFVPKAVQLLGQSPEDY